MTGLSNDSPDPSPPPATKRQSLWGPLIITFLSSAGLAWITCAGGFTLGKGFGSLGLFLFYAGLMFLGICGLSLIAIVVYFFVWIIRILVS